MLCFRLLNTYCLTLAVLLLQYFGEMFHDISYRLPLSLPQMCVFRDGLRCRTVAALSTGTGRVV